MKKYNGLLAFIMLFLAIGLNASNRSSFERIFDRITNNVFVQCVDFYACSSVMFHAIGKTLCACSGAPIVANKIIDFDALYNDTFPKNYSPKSVVQKIAAHASRGCLIAGSVCSAPLRSIVSVTYNSIESFGEEMAFKRHIDNLKREACLSSEKLVDLESLPNVSMSRIVKQTVRQMTRGSLYSVLGFGVPYVYSKIA